MQVGRLLRQTLVRGNQLTCPTSYRHLTCPTSAPVRHRHPDTKPEDETIELTPEQILVNRRPFQEQPTIFPVTLVHERPMIIPDSKQPRRNNLLRPRWPEQFVIEPVVRGRYGIVVLESSRMQFNCVKASKEFIIAHSARGEEGIWVRYLPDYPMSQMPLNTKRGKGNTKAKTEYYADTVMAGRVLIEFDADPNSALIIYEGVAKRMPVCMMLVKGADHTNAVRMTDKGKRDRMGLKVFKYELEYADGTKKMFSLPRKYYKTNSMTKVIMEDMQLDYSFMKHKSFGNDRLRVKRGNAFN